jgi:hypothetical protein
LRSESRNSMGGSKPGFAPIDFSDFRYLDG